MTLRRATVVGAGRIGLYLGGCLLYAGWKVRFVGRKEFGNQIAENGALILSNLQQQFELKFDNDLFTYKEKLEKGDIESGDFLIICVKRADSEKIAQELLALEISNFNLISFQNGVDNTKTYCDILKNVQFTPISAIFGPNVIKVDDQIAHFKLATSNPIIIEQTEHSEILQAAFTHGKTAEGPFLECEITQNLRGVMFGKLMLNLNNSINALTGLPLKDELRSKKVYFSNPTSPCTKNIDYTLPVQESVILCHERVVSCDESQQYHSSRCIATFSTKNTALSHDAA